MAHECVWTNEWMNERTKRYNVNMQATKTNTHSMHSYIIVRLLMKFSTFKLIGALSSLINKWMKKKVVIIPHRVSTIIEKQANFVPMISWIWTVRIDNI